MKWILREKDLKRLLIDIAVKLIIIWPYLGANWMIYEFSYHSSV